MPSAEQFGATPDEIQQYGTSISIWEALKLLQKYAPLVSYVREFVTTLDPYRKGLIVSDACEWIASQTETKADDQLVRLLADLLKTSQGEALVRWCLLQVEAAR
jgi:hypothetical protein